MRKTEPGAQATPTVQVIERMFALMDVLASREEAMSLKEISEKTGLHPSTTHRILNDLATGRFVDRPHPGNYRLGMRLLELGNLVKSRLNVRDAALLPMREQLSAHLWWPIFLGREIKLAGKLDPKGFLPFVDTISGSRWPGSNGGPRRE